MIIDAGGAPYVGCLGVFPSLGFNDEEFPDSLANCLMFANITPFML